MEAVEQHYFHVVMFIMLYNVVLTFKSVNETLVCDLSNESYWAVLLCGTVCYVGQRCLHPLHVDLCLKQILVPDHSNKRC